MLTPDDPGSELGNVFPNPYYNANEGPQSPKPPNAQWRGVMIAAPNPAVITLRNPQVLLHGTYRIQGANYPANDSLKLTAIEMVSKKEFTAIAGQHDASPSVPPPPEAPPDPQMLKRMVFSGFFNTDLIATLKLPRVGATYRVRADLGNIPSNEIMVQITLQ